VRHLVDVAARGGNLLLNVGPTAGGVIPDGQRRTLEGLADWMARHSAALHDSRPLDPAVADPSDAPWVRWTRTGERVWAVADAPGGAVVLPARADRLDLASAALADGTPVPARAHPGGIAVELPAPAETPVAVAFTAT
jgi:alpha-L-fucosidase